MSPAGLDQQVRRRARDTCEYCRLPQSFSQLQFTIDHIIARQHGGKTELENLSLCCGFCNRHKGPNIAGIDPGSGRVTRLFNPRRDRWSKHFRMEGATVVGISAIGRTTAHVLAMNNALQLARRSAILSEGENTSE